MTIINRAGRLGDFAFCVVDRHDCPDCPHKVGGPSIIGSANVFINNRPALRVGDYGKQSKCRSTNEWKARKGATYVHINGREAHRTGDNTKHCGGTGHLVTGSRTVLIGDHTHSPVLRQSSRVAFKVVDESGHPLVGYFVLITSPDGDELMLSTDCQGRIEIANAKSGTYVLSPKHRTEVLTFSKRRRLE